MVRFMTRIFTDRLSTLTSFALAMFLALVLNAKIKADCGDYAHLGARSAHQATTPSSQKSPPPAPCHGPGCKRRQAPYTPAPAPSQSQSNSDWLLMPANAVAAPD